MAVGATTVVASLDGPVPRGLVELIVSLARGDEPRVCVVGPRGDAAAKAFGTEGIAPEQLDDPFELDAIVLADADPRSVVEHWRPLRDRLLAASESGTLLVGLGRAGIAWFHSGVVRLDGEVVDPFWGLGVLPISLCRHHRTDDEATGAYYGLIHRDLIPSGLAIDDGVAVVLRGASVGDVVSWRTGAHAYDMSLMGGEVTLKGLWARPGA